MNGSDPDLWYYAQRMLSALPATLWLAAAGTALALAGGAVAAVCRTRGVAPLRALVLVYIELIRGTPPLIQLFILYFGITQFGVFLSPEVAGVLWLAISGAAYAAEIFRAGLASVPNGQNEAAMALSLGRYQTFSSVIFPQAVIKVFPPLTTFIILQIKSTTFLFVIGVQEILYEARLGVTMISQPLAIYAIAAVIFVAINLAAECGLGYMRRRISVLRA